MLFEPIKVYPSCGLRDVAYFFYHLSGDVRVHHLVDTKNVKVVSRVGASGMVVVLQGHHLLFHQDSNCRTFLFLLSFVIRYKVVSVVFEVGNFSIASTTRAVKGAYRPSLVKGVFVPTSLHVRVTMSHVRVSIFVRDRVRANFPSKYVL